MPRIDEGVEAHAREGAGLARGDVAEQVRDHPLRQVVGLDLVLQREALELRAEPPVPADHPPHQPFVAEVVEAAPLPVALAGGVDQREITRPALFQEPPLQLLRDGLGEADADEAAGSYSGAVAHKPDRFRGGDDLVPPGDLAPAEQGVPALSRHRCFLAGNGTATPSIVLNREGPALLRSTGRALAAPAKAAGE